MYEITVSWTLSSVLMIWNIAFLSPMLMPFLFLCLHEYCMHPSCIYKHRQLAGWRSPQSETYMHTGMWECEDLINSNYFHINWLRNKSELSELCIVKLCVKAKTATNGDCDSQKSATGQIFIVRHNHCLRFTDWKMLNIKPCRLYF